MNSALRVEGAAVPSRSLQRLVWVVGALHLAAGAFMFLAPRAFYDQVGTFRPFNGHYVRDLATWYVAFGVALLLATRRPSWQAPLLALVVIQYALHVVNHVIDVGDPRPEWKGPATVVSLAVIGGVLWWLWRDASRTSRR